MNDLEALLFWLSALLMAGSFGLALWALVLRRPAGERAARLLPVLAAAVLTVLWAARWIRAGHPPFVSFFESMLTAIWLLALVQAWLRLRHPLGPAVQVPASGIALLLLGWGSTLPHAATPLSAALDNVWLFIHASFATAGAATFLAAASFGLVFALGGERSARLRAAVPALPEHASLPGTVSRLLILGLVLWGVMIASGSIWAHAAWGRYWGWDPVEVWSLIGWLLYAGVYHARLALRLSPRTFCILVVAAALTIVFSLWGVQYVYETIHEYG